MKTYTFNTKEKMLDKYIDLFASLYVDDERKWLTPREKDYFIGLILKNNEGVDLVSKECDDYLENELNFKNRGISIYRLKLKNKGWIFQTKKGIEIVKAFDFKGKNLPKSVIFNFKLEWEL